MFFKAVFALYLVTIALAVPKPEPEGRGAHLGNNDWNDR